MTLNFWIEDISLQRFKNFVMDLVTSKIENKASTRKFS